MAPGLIEVTEDDRGTTACLRAEHARDLGVG
jgi:hypothetical protein